MIAHAHLAAGGGGGAAHLVLDLHRDGKTAGFIRVELRPDRLADLRPAAHARVGQEDAALGADVEERAVPAHIDDLEPGDLPLLHLRHAHAGREAPLRILVEEDLYAVADSNGRRLLRLVQQDVVMRAARLRVEERAHLTEARDGERRHRARLILAAGAHRACLPLRQRRAAPPHPAFHAQSSYGVSAASAQRCSSA